MTVVLLEALSFGLGRLADAAASLGRRLVLFTGDRSIYRHELRSSPVEVVDVDTFDANACTTALSRVSDLAGLISSTDTWAIPGARLAADFGLPGPPVEAVRTLRDKARVRQLLHARGLSRGTAVDASAALTDFPLVVKDSAGTSSRDVSLVHSAEELRAVLSSAGPLKGRLIAEPFLAGPVYSAETLTWAGQTRLLGVSSRQLSREFRFREESAAFPVAFGDKDSEVLRAWVAEVLAVAGHERGFAHVEFVLTGAGPELVEINARIGGALVGEALCRSLGTNVYEAMVQMALGARPALLDSPVPGGPAVAFSLIYPARPGRLRGWSGLDALSAYPGDPEWYPTAAAGDTITALPDQRACTGLVLVHGDTAELAAHRALAAAASIHPLID
ncbi:ATP-grasp domain-containing protein [Amycolatopsis sp. 195334CR]|uniref:ATP-grasp domain-containing protein n=1 Tax=Amycolatopsis sp. 195334CR TaxID=2814588 RepID=UPI001A8DE0DF|nr:ATP-grasp domain-containing protein [Amycolatopsis sp. 195334CR]MBN6037995.1 ATP-grasp domain-containing protein [Amycolatopsis sp. 195334CR]